MIEQSDAEKEKPPDSEDVSQQKGKDGGGELQVQEKESESASRPPLVYQNSAVSNLPDQEDSKSERMKALEKVDRKPSPSPKLNGVKTGTVRSRRDEERRSSPSKPARKPESRSVNSGSFRRDTDKNRSPADAGKPFSDDSRLSKLVRRLERETEKDRRTITAKQLRDCLRTAEGSKAALKNSDDLLSVLQNIFFERGYKDVKLEVATCVGVVGSLMGSDAQRFFQWLFGQINSPIDDDTRALFLLALREMIECYDKKQMSDFIPMVLNNVQTLLETADTPELLMAVVNVILKIARIHPHDFSPYFRDTVDILVGWHIDATQRTDLIDFTSTALISFRTFWVSDLSFTKELLGQFLEDMEAYAEDISISIGVGSHATLDTPVPDEIVKITALLKVFSTVVRSLGEDFSPAQSRQVTIEYTLQVLDKTVRSVDCTARCYFSEHMMLAANECIGLLFNLAQTTIVSILDVVVPYIQVISFPTQQTTYKFQLSVLKLLQTTVTLLNTKLPLETLSQLLSSESLLHTCRLTQSGEVTSKLLSVYNVILGLKSVPLLEEAYRYLLGDFQQAYNSLLTSCGKTGYLDLVAGDNPFANVKHTSKTAETTCIFDLCALAEIGNAKGSVIGMWALTPSIFELYISFINIQDATIAVNFPAVQYAVVHSLYSHCARHGNFVSSSSLLTQNTALEGSILANVNPTTSGNFAKILSLLAEVLVDQHTPYDTRFLALKWVMEVITGLQTSQHVFTTREFMTVVQALYHTGYSLETQLILGVYQCLQNIFKNPAPLPIFLVKGCVELCVFRLSDENKIIHESYLSLFCLLPINVTASHENGLYMLDEGKILLSHDLTTGLKAEWQSRRNHISRVPLGTFHSHNFKQVISFLLNNTQPKQTGSLHWLEAMYHSSQRTSAGNHKYDVRPIDGSVLQDCVNGNSALLWFWAMWEAAQFCVLARLRTTLGKPQETFTSIESVLKSFAAEVSTQSTEDEDKKKGLGDPDSTQRLRAHMLIQFMEFLEKLLYNAYEGAAVAMSSVPKAVKTFFRTNKNTCVEWLSRVRGYIINISLHLGLYPMVIRQTSQILSEMKAANNTQSTEFEQMLQYHVQGLCKLGDTESILGMYAWCRDILGKKLTWIKAAAEKASGRYENAVKEYKSSMRSLLSADDKYDSPRDTSADQNQMRITGILSKQGAESTATSSQHIPVAKMNFIVNEIVDSYMSLSDWESVLQWQEAMAEMRAESSVQFPQSAFNTNVDLCSIRALSSFDLGKFDDVREQLELVPGASLSDMNSDFITDSLGNQEKMLSQSVKQFIRVATVLQDQRTTNHKNDLVKCLKQVEALGETVLRLESFEWPVLMSHDTVAELAIVSTLKSQLEDKRSKTWLLPLSENLQVASLDHDVSTFLHAIQLVRLQQVCSVDKKAELSNELNQLQLATASLARKQQNFTLSEKLLLNQASSLLKIHSENGRLVSVDCLKSSVTKLRSANGGINAFDIIRMERESSKLLHGIGQQKDAIDVLSNSVVGFVCSDASSTEKSACSELCSRSLLTLVKWLQIDHKYLSGLSGQLSSTGQGDSSARSQTTQNLQLLLEMEEKGVQKNLGIVLEGTSTELRIGENPILSDTDRIVGRLLHLCTIECQVLPKAWYALAGWCYKWGRKAVDNASHGSVELFTDEKAQILSLLPKGTSHEETDSVLTILSQIHSAMTSDEDISDQDQSQYDDGTETTRRQLLSTCTSLQTGGQEDSLEKLLDVWQGVVQRVYHYYQLSAKAYFTFLHLNGGTSVADMDNEDWNVISTLRVLRLLVKHAWELRNVLENGLAVTPTAPWKGIIPQLFSRLSHPEAYVRQSISDLLCRVAEDAPHLIVYPAVVGSSTTRVSTKPESETGLLNNYLSEEFDENGVGQADQPSQEEEDEELDVEDESSSTMLQNCLTAIVETLATHSPQMIADVKQMIQELRRITLLWDELWLGTLSQQHQDVERRISQLENEIKKVNNNTTLTKEEKTAIIREKHKTVLKPTVYTLERVQEITSQPWQTPHEKWFQQTYGELINNAMEKLKNPPNPNHPRASWHPFKQIHVSLQQKAQKRSSLLLRMNEISPKLESLKNTVIAMPGLGTLGQVVTIESMSNSVHILPTKTKPKKLVFKGSDGKRYPYLFKGLEDLHLDERIMQFLNIINNMFASAYKGCHQLYRARHYSVTPLGPRSGLIQWVDGATPLFGLYKRWQQREATVQMLKQQSNGTTGNNANAQPNIPRPSEVYYNKLTPALREKGIKDLDNRKDWPLSTLKKVLEELMKETPGDLLARELWCSSTGPNEWWYVQQTYARSTAVMSMIGYIIGLGDRHLDNVLVDLATGEVVHIDYNVCFEKGKSLRVSEKVPFRLTQNIETALGVTGVEGTFRSASEHVIKTMRKGRETLLTLLEAFVYDPLVDWTTGNESGYTGAFYGGELSTATSLMEIRQSKRDMEREITVSMFSIRVAEMKVAWLQNRDEMLSVLPRVQDQLGTLDNKGTEYIDSHTALEKMQDLKQFASDSLSDPSSQVYTLHERFKEYSVIKTTQDTVHTLVEEKVNEFSNWQKMHKHVIKSLQGTAFKRLCTDVANTVSLGASSFTAAKDFLQGAGQGQIITQCEQVENEMTANMQLQRSNLHRSIDILHTYGTIVSQFGMSLAENNRTGSYLCWLQELICNFTTDGCAQVIHEFHDLYGDRTYAQSKVRLVMNTEDKLHTITNDVNNRLIKLVERRSLEKLSAPILEQQVQDGCLAIDMFVRDNDTAGVCSLTGVVATVLCSLNKRYLQMEGAAAGAGDRLMDLTSRDGDWFLDELCSMSGNVMQFLEMMKNSKTLWEREDFQSLYRGLMSTHNVYVALQDLNVNFRKIILPEALKTIQAQDSSVFGILTSLERILAIPDKPLDTVVNQLETQHRNAIMGLKNDNTDMMSTVQKMQADFTKLLEGQGQSGQELTSGQMLLMGFNGLFTLLDDRFTSMLESVDSLDISESWRKVDSVREARSMQMSSFTSSTRSLLSILFFIKRLQVMQEFFHMCTQSAASLQGMEGGNCFDDEQLSKPVKRFIAEYVRKQVIGFPSQLLGYILCQIMNTMGLNVNAEIELKDIGAENKVPQDDLCKKAVDMCLRSGQFQHVHLTQASTLTSAQDSIWRRHDLTRRLDTNIDLMKSSLQRAQLHLTRLHWLHEDVFIQAGHHQQHNQLVIPNRATVMSEIKKCMQSLVSQEGTLSTCQSQYSQLEGSITQRLRWAAGANPSLNLVLQQFEEASNVRKLAAEEEMKHSQEIVSLCQGILHLEALRTKTPEALTSDNNFLALINKCNESCILTESASCTVTDQETQLLAVKSIEDGQRTDIEWFKSAQKKVIGQIKEMDAKVLTVKEDMDAAKDGIKAEVTNIRTTLTSHHKLMSDIRAVLKSLTKQEEQEMGEKINPGGIRDYLNLYKKFSENFTTALKMLYNDDIDRDGITETNSILDALQESIPQIYEDLLQLAPPLLKEADKAEDIGPSSLHVLGTKKMVLSGEEISGAGARRASALHRELLTGTPPNSPYQTGQGTKPSVSTPVKKAEKVTRDPKTGKAIQERNSYAVGVWRRVKMKLDGRDPDQNKRLSVAEQVDYVIKDATNMDNLAVLYEGWTPWV